MRSKKALYNTLVGILQEVVAAICAFILPRLILGAFGSSYNGVTSSITQFLSCIVLLRAGVGGVTKAALYKPLSEDDMEQISGIVRATEIFMRKVALIFTGFLIVFACTYPILVKQDFNWFFTFSLIFILGISTFSQYYFGVAYQLLLQADQRQYVISIIQIITTIISTIIATIFIRVGGSIHVVQLGSAVVFTLNPLIIHLYVRHRYKVIKNVTADTVAIKQRWDAFAHQVALFIHSNTDIMILTIFTNVREVSVYSVYSLVINGMNNIVKTFVSGVSAAFGNMLAKNEMIALERNFRIYELIIFTISTVLFTTAGILLVPFVLVYTMGVGDVNYSRPLFAWVITVAAIFNCYRIPYQAIVEAAGHFKQTKNGAIFEAILNICLSLMLVSKFGLTGVAVGTLCAIVFRSCQYSVYLSKHLLRRSIGHFIGHVTTSIITAGIIVILSIMLLTLNSNSYLAWAADAVCVLFIAVICMILCDFLFYKEDCKALMVIAKNLLKKRKYL